MASKSGWHDLPPELQAFALYAAKADDPVHIHGETGSGKTHLARVIHEQSARRKQKMVSVNCAGYPSDLIDRELNGSVPGAFTGATNSPGFIEAADGSTLFLDEIGHLPFKQQAKFLKVVEEKVVRRLGSTRDRPVDFRLITAMSQDLQELVDKGEFLPAFGYRINVLSCRVTPLREQPEALPGLIERHLRMKLKLPSDATLDQMVGPGVIELLQAQPWRGNIRELFNVADRASFEAHGELIRVSHIRKAIQVDGHPTVAPHGSPGAKEKKVRYEPPDDPEEERKLLLATLKAESWNKSRSAKRLGMGRNTLLWKMDRFGIPRDPPPPDESDDVWTR